jgi:hypothetical protein
VLSEVGAELGNVPGMRCIAWRREGARRKPALSEEVSTRDGGDIGRRHRPGVNTVMAVFPELERTIDRRLHLDLPRLSSAVAAVNRSSAMLRRTASNDDGTGGDDEQ